MLAARKFDQELRDRAVRMYRDRREQHEESRLETRRQMGAVLDIDQATLRNRVEEAERREGTRPGVAARAGESEEVRALKRRVAELERANEILETASAFFAQAELDRRLR
jgi:transposase